MRRMLLLVAFLSVAALPGRVCPESFDPQKYFMEKAKKGARPEERKKSEVSEPVLDYSGPSGIGSPRIIWIVIAVGCAVVFASLYGWSRHTGGIMSRVDSEIDKEVMEFIDDIGVKEFYEEGVRKNDKPTGSNPENN